jgi:hypothetical protein
MYIYTTIYMWLLKCFIRKYMHVCIYGLYAYIYIYIYMYLYVHIYICIHTLILVFEHIFNLCRWLHCLSRLEFAYLFLRIHIYIYVYIYMYIYTCMTMHKYTYICVYVYKYIDKHVFGNIHITCWCLYSLFWSGGGNKS